MIDWPWAIAGYLTFGSLALFLQYKSHVAALDRLMTAHDKNVADLRFALEILQLTVLHEREVKQAKLNRVTHAEFAEGAVSD